MCVNPIATLQLKTGEVHFPDTFERKPSEDIGNAGASVFLIAPEIGEIEQDAAIGLFRDGGEEVTIGHFTGAVGEIVNTGFECEREPEGGGATANVVRGEFHAGRGL